MVIVSRASVVSGAVMALASFFTPSSGAVGSDPLLLRAARGEAVERPPVWMMRQAGRHMKAYRDLVQEYPTFRQRSETPSVALEISLQPFQAYGVDGVILFSDILTPLPAMGIHFEIGESGKIAIDPIRSAEGLRMRLKRTTDYTETCATTGKVLSGLREAVGNRATVLGFIGLPYTIATYLIEGKTAKASQFSETRKLQETGETWLRDLLSLLADNLVDYACYQIESGAQVLQVFDSWAGHLNDDEYKRFALPYQQKVIRGIKVRHPETPIIIYVAPAKYSERGKRLGLLALSGADVVSVDHTVDLKGAREILASHSVGIVQGNLDPDLLKDGSLDEIQAATQQMLEEAKGAAHIANLGHGILPDTPEEKAAFFVKTVQEYRY